MAAPPRSPLSRRFGDRDGPSADRVGGRREGEPDRQLRRYAASRDPQDLDALVRRFHPLARRLALRYVRAAEPLDDLEQVACLGLVKALQRFDPTRGYAFTSFAVPTIVGELKRSLRDTAWTVHVPRSVQERAAAVRAAGDRLELELGRPATVNDIAAALGIALEAVLEAVGALDSMEPLSIDGPSKAREDVPISDLLGQDDGGYERIRDRVALQRAVPSLSDLQRSVLRLRFEEDLKQSEIARRLEVSQMQVSRVLRTAVERLQTLAAHQSRIPRSHVCRAGQPAGADRPTTRA